MFFSYEIEHSRGHVLKNKCVVTHLRNVTSENVFRFSSHTRVVKHAAILEGQFSRLRGIFVASPVTLIVDNALSTNFHFASVLPPNVEFNTLFERNTDSVRFEVTASRGM